MNNKIPKKIHYCWFGNGEKNNLIKSCMNSWKEYLQDYEIKEWNENNFDINCNKYVKEAYEAKKWAFVSDYVRLFALYEEGGVYLDTDVELTNNIDEFLVHSAFIGFDSDTRVSSALIASMKGHNFIKRLLDYYKDMSFTKIDGSFDYKTNIETITEICVNEYELKLNNSKQIINEDVHIFPKEYFTVNNNIDKNYAIHHFNASWVPREEIIRQLKTYKSYYFFMLTWMEKILKDEIDMRVVFSNKKVAIYGLGYIGRLLIKQCLKNNVKIKCIIDNGITEKSFENIEVIKSSTLPEKEIELIVVTPIMSFEDIKSDLKKYVSSQIVSLEDIIYESY
ncbi:TPA: glycosyl transferase [Clostridium botulinum]|uniref:glycosyltransferase family 32 protein n=1 Tax=Clostridium botulinum TaxID=1491 RepID=UPI00099C2A81|nr:glycosyltransferase [Clostridium botulinum]HCL4438287.1 glycosyl transferase [Clostridium botulinum]HCL4449580.1 glycosyl transferase [Clostridium botulinum]HCL4454080.1 glycosyl transferase [Clostridium botulinum]HCL4465078.1 glycosyl transferase [Clostridium botulinum]HCL4468770.1 glycosyl transferase [Clostridium botulinum]